ncbi:myosin regulatory light chain 2, ventricular/cardiac muscle isoform isoform X2 [Tamandua tetradactyla]|uniref:myosin regulatory light chain 2, ventricular/cardiac muscle isoform isoform X2 n=1 Tax=Tamandua tetradactyla TaxID=48850 RepID=UPI004053DB4D
MQSGVRIHPRTSCRREFETRTDDIFVNCSCICKAIGVSLGASTEKKNTPLYSSSRLKVGSPLGTPIFFGGGVHGPEIAPRSPVWKAFTIMDQNRDGFIDKNDLRDTFAALGRVNVKNEEIDEMLKEAPGPINFTVFLTMFGEKLKGADPEETILNAFKVFDPEGKGVLKADYVREMLTTQAERFSKEEVLNEQAVVLQTLLLNLQDSV